MKVRCIKILDSEGKLQERSQWLTLGKVYHVLEVFQDSRNKWFLRLAPDGANAIALFFLEEFEVVSAKIPDVWIAAWYPKGGFALTTEAWNRDGFWEAYYDQDPVALRKFEDGRRQIVDADP
jgi:hypothetical protein